MLAAGLIGKTNVPLLFPENWKDFTEYFVDENQGMKHINKFQNRIVGLVSHVSHLSTIGKMTGLDIKNQIESISGEIKRYRNQENNSHNRNNDGDVY